MRIQFHKISNSEHRVSVIRSDGSMDSNALASRSFLFHDFAHLAIEIELPLLRGFWGNVADGRALDDPGELEGELAKAEALAGPIQTLIKNNASAADFHAVLARLLPDQPELDHVADSILQRARALRGQWRATHFGKHMEVQWPH